MRLFAFFTQLNNKFRHEFYRTLHSNIFKQSKSDLLSFDALNFKYPMTLLSDIPVRYSKFKIQNS